MPAKQPFDPFDKKFDPRVFAVYVSWLTLRPDQRQRCISMMASFGGKDEKDQDDIKRKLDEAIASFDPGPLKSPCPTCGRG